MTATYERLKLAVNKASQELRAYICETQVSCKHPTVVEAPAIHSPYGRSTPPFRVCMQCGMSEEGWGCGYIVLHGEPGRELTTVPTRAELNAHTRGLHIAERDKGPLLRGETTVEQLIENHYE